MSSFQFTDIHSHISFPPFDADRQAVLARMEEAGVAAITVGVDYASSVKAVEVAEQHENLWATIGLHPGDNRTEIFDESRYRELLSSPKVVAVGECGFDYLRISGEIEQEKKRQRDAFERQIEFAVAHDLPLMIHCREAHADCIDMLTSKKSEHGEKLRGNIHFFSEGKETAKKYFDLDFTISFTGVITFTHDYDEAVAYAPLEMIMSETDCPWVAPVPYRGTRNEPVYIKEVVAKIAEIRGEDFERVREAMIQNAIRVFSVKVIS